MSEFVRSRVLFAALLLLPSLAVTSRIYAQVKIKSPEELRTAAVERSLEMLIGDWQLDMVELAREKDYLRTVVDNSEETVCKLTVTKETITSKTVDGKLLRRQHQDGELFNKTTKFKLGEPADEKMEITFVNASRDDKKAVTHRYLYVADAKKLIMVCDSLNAESYPDGLDLEKGRDKGRMAFFFSRVNKK